MMYEARLCHPLIFLPCMVRSLTTIVLVACIVLSGSVVLVACIVLLSGSVILVACVVLSGSVVLVAPLYCPPAFCWFALFPVKDCFTSSNALPSSCSAALNASPALFTKSCAFETALHRMGRILLNQEFLFHISHKTSSFSFSIYCLLHG